jgi:hypothetical protein
MDTIEKRRMIKRLLDASFSKSQAKALAEEVHATTRDLENNQYLEIKFAHLVGQMDGKLEKLRADLFKWFISAMLTQTSVIIPLLMSFLGIFGK